MDVKQHFNQPTRDTRGQSDGQRHRQTNVQADETDRQTDRQTETDRDRQTDRDRDSETETDREREIQPLVTTVSQRQSVTFREPLPALKVSVERMLFYTH